MFSSRMNRLPTSLILVLFGLMAFAVLACPRDARAVSRVSFGVNIDTGDYDYLQGYGEWVNVPRFGTCWHPYVVADWEPFMHGHWVWSYDGWAWNSYEPYGWLVYHYGYWYNEPQIGWFWVPGRTWSPACVQWYTFGDYTAWAPLAPPGYSWYDPWHRFDFNVWFVVGFNHFADDDVWRYREAEPPHRGMFERGPIYRRSPSIRTVENFTHRSFSPVRIPRENVNLREQMARQPESRQVNPQERYDHGRMQAGTPARGYNPQQAPQRYSRPRQPERQRLMFPQHEQQRADQYAPRVQREVMVPREQAQRHEQIQAPRPQERSRQGSPAQNRGGGQERRRR